MIGQAIHYVLQMPESRRRLQLPWPASGGFGGSGFARSAAGCCALYYAGIFDGDNLKRGLDYIKQFTPAQGGGRGEGQHYFYGYYYATQAMFLAGGDYWASFYPAIRDELIQQPEQRPLDRRSQRRLRHLHGADHPADAQPLSAGLRRQHRPWPLEV